MIPDGINFIDPFRGVFQHFKSTRLAPGSFFTPKPRLKSKLFAGAPIKKKPLSWLDLKCCGERGIRTPGGFTLNGFQDRRNRPLCHLSGAKVQFFSLSKTKKLIRTCSPVKSVFLQAEQPNSPQPRQSRRQFVPAAHSAWQPCPGKPDLWKKPASPL